METIRARGSGNTAAARPGGPGAKGGGRYDDHTAPAPATFSAQHGAAAAARPSGGTGHAPFVFKLLLGAADAAALCLATVVAAAMAARTGASPTGDAADLTRTMGLLAIPAWIFALVRAHAYQSRFIASRLQELRHLAFAGLGGAGAMLIISDLSRRISIQRDFVLFSFVLGVALLAAEREVARRLFRHLRRQGYRMRRVAIVGDNHEGARLHRLFEDSPELGYSFAGFIATGAGRRGVVHPDDVLGGLDDAVEVLQRKGVENVMIAASAIDIAHSALLVRNLLKAGITVEFSSGLHDVDAARLSVRPLGPVPVMYLEPQHQAGWRSGAKRCFDFVLAAGGLVVLALPLLIVSVLVKLDSEGPVFFRQTRVGRHGKHFDVIKFRTMVRNAAELRDQLAAQNEADGPLFKIRNDPRITRVGRFLRKSSIDEIPQLWNVVRGEMSLVGPRPALPEEAERWSPELYDRLRVQPGITGMWQVNGRASSSFDDYRRFDLSYVDNWSLLKDLEILGRTIPAVLLQRGAS